MTFYDERDDRPATEAEAHAEWHRNAGHPMDQPGCPWDCCDGPDSYGDYDEPGDSNRTEVSPVVSGSLYWAPDPDDVPF